MLTTLFDKLSNMFRNILLLLDDMLENTPVLLSIALGLFLASVTIALFYLVKEKFFKITRIHTGGIELIEGIRPANRPVRISNNPNDFNYKEIPRSYNEKEGISFTYNLWFVVNKPNSEKWQHIIHKGSSNGYPLRAPGVWMKGNTLKVSMNTVDKIDNSIEIKNIPVKKWCMLTLVLRGHTLEVFMNGYLKNTLNFGSKIPRLNDEAIYITHWDGFDGYIANVNYFNYPVTGTEIQNLFDEGPTTDACSIGFDIPPYLATGVKMSNVCDVK